MSVSFQNARSFDTYRNKHMATFDTPLDRTLPDDLDVALLHVNSAPCKTYLQAFVAMNTLDNCFAVAAVQNTNFTYNVIRFNDDVDYYGISKEQATPAQYLKFTSVYETNNTFGIVPTAGYFRKIPLEKGFTRQREKLSVFLEHFSAITDDLHRKLSDMGVKKGDDLAVMVVNEGEIDLFFNFACSASLHNISLSQLLVFGASSEIIPLIESTGALAIYHPAFGTVSRKASADYLDRVFVDMMWYKAFSIFLLLRMDINVLFQDIDIVWFQNPFKYFRDYLAKFDAEFHTTGSFIEAFFSDDGQRSMRYTPFYANSGFYYLRANRRSEYFAWSLMTAFDAVQRLGSHQNVLTARLSEGISLGHRNVKILPMDDFPNGILYHHDPNFLKRMRSKEIVPYMFHMCWTQGKTEKLEYLFKSKMWYLSKRCSSLSAFTADDSPTRDGPTPSVFSKSKFKIPADLEAPPGEINSIIISKMSAMGIDVLSSNSSLALSDSNRSSLMARSYTGIHDPRQRDHAASSLWKNHIFRMCCESLPSAP
jgi:hypothetical protein